MPQACPGDLFDRVLVGHTNEPLRLMQEPYFPLQVAPDPVHPSARHAADSNEPAVVEVSN